MVDLISFLSGVLGALLTLALLKVVDIILEHLINETFFSKIWTIIVKTIKKFQTRWNPIITSFQFRIKIDPSEPLRVKEEIIKLVNSLSEKHKGQIAFSHLAWTDTNRVGSVKATYNKRDFRIAMHISSEYRDFEPEEEIFRSTREVSEISDSVALSIEVNFPFKSLEPLLLSLSSLTNFIKEQVKDIFPVTDFSKGLFTIAPIKADFTMNHWIKEKRFDVSLLLKAQENIMVNLYPKKAEIIFPTLQIDEKVSEYLRGTILNYYL